MSTSALHWHLFCHVVDNLGDLGVAWRLAGQIGQTGQSVTLWCDDASALQWMAPQGHPKVRVCDWPTTLTDSQWPDRECVVVELFGCTLPQCAQQRIARQRQSCVWINLEYLSAQDYVARNHGLPSPVTSGPAKGLTKWFFYPGFTPASGGLLREFDLGQSQADFDRRGWRQRRGAAAQPDPNVVWISLFCYEPAILGAALDALSDLPHRLLITAGRAQRAVAAHRAGQRWPRQWQTLALMPHSAFDHVLWGCDLNCVRGEDSLVRALWAGQALLWQAYPQHDNAHLAKLDAWLRWMDAPSDWQDLHWQWNTGAAGQWRWPSAAQIQTWGEAVRAARQRLLKQPSLLSQLQHFIDQRLLDFGSNAESVARDAS